MGIMTNNPNDPTPPPGFSLELEAQAATQTSPGGILLPATLELREVWDDVDDLDPGVPMSAPGAAGVCSDDATLDDPDDTEDVPADV